MNKSVFSILFVVFFSISSFAQTILRNDGANIRVDGNVDLVIENGKFVNNGTFDAQNGDVWMVGNAAAAQTAIEGTSSTTFFNLNIDKNTGDVLLNQNAAVANDLTFWGGNLDIGNNILTIENNAIILGADANHHVKTTGTGTLSQQVGGSPIEFPIGASSYNPITLENSGTTDRFDVRVEDNLLINGTSASAVTTDAVDRSWYVNEAVEGGSDLTMQVVWNAGEELPNFDRTQSYISYWSNGTWQGDPANAAGGSDPYTLTRNNLTQLNTVFAVGSSGKLTTNTENIVTAPMKINLFPNPTVDQVNLELGTAIDGASVILYDVTGYAIQSVKMPTTELSLDVAKLPAGTYFLSIVEGNRIIQSKSFVKVTK